MDPKQRFRLRREASERKDQFMKRNTNLLVCTLGAALLLGGCGNAQREATEAAVNAAQTAINAATNAAQKYVPDETKAAQDALQSAKDSLAKGEYGAALTKAKQAAQKAKDALSLASAKKEEWTNNWNSLNQSAPKTMSEVQAKLDAYKKSGKLPKGVDQAQMDAARAQYEQLKQSWTDATAAYKSGNIADAMNKVPGLKERLAKLKELLGISSS
jgi:DNA repair exonuclease SbcCD ATPase subunit